MVKFLLIAFGVVCILMAPFNADAAPGDVQIQYLLGNRGDGSLDISVDGATLVGFIPKELSIDQTGRIEWHVTSLTTGWALFKRKSTFEIRVNGVKSDREVIFGDKVRAIRIEIDRNNEISITLLDAPQDLD